MMLNKQLMKELPQAKPFIIKQVLMQWLALLCTIAIIFIISDQLWKTFTHSLTHQGLFIGFGSMIILLILKSWLTKQQSKYSFLASKGVKDELRQRIYGKLIRLKQAYQKDFSTSELVQLSVEGIDQLEIYFGRYLPQFFYSMLAPLTLFIILVWIDFSSALVLLLCVPLIPMSIIAIQKFAKKLLAKYWTSYTTLGDSFLENLQGLTTLKIYQADALKHEAMNKEAQEFRHITMKVLTMQLNSVSVMDIVAYGGAALGSVFACLHYLDGSLSFAGAICIVLLSAEFFLPLRLLGSYFHIAMNGIAASDKILRLLELPEDEIGSQTLQHPQPTIYLEHLKFCYEEDRYVLSDINTTIPANSFVAICGESGSGKSTLAKLLMGIKKGYEGRIRFDDIDRKDILDDSFYRNFTYVSHLPLMIKGTLRDNLAMASTKLISDTKMKDVLKQVQLYDFFANEQGLHTEILENGANLSGGQKQRLAIARALLKDSDGYIFDEATSNIDVDSEALILTLIKQLAKQKSVIFITHRLRAVMDCDQILMLQQGQLKEQGTHLELMKRSGLYHELFTKQEKLEQYRGGSDYA